MPTADPITPPPARRRGPFPRPWTPDEFALMRRLGLFAGRAVALDHGVVVEAGTPVPFTRAEYYDLWSANVFSNQRVQLVRGVIVQEPPMNPPHATGVRKATKALDRVFTVGYDVRPQLPLNLKPISEPHPDVAIVTGSTDDYAIDHPTTAVLVVEVADDSLFDDTTTKAEVYAEAGIPEYWVLDVNGRRLLVLRDSAAVAAGGHAYRTQLVFAPTDTVSPLAAPNATITVADLLP